MWKIPKGRGFYITKFTLHNNFKGSLSITARTFMAKIATVKLHNNVRM